MKNSDWIPGTKEEGMNITPPVWREEGVWFGEVSRGR